VPGAARFVFLLVLLAAVGADRRDGVGVEGDLAFAGF
jgi:hypothetical protein